MQVSTSALSHSPFSSLCCLGGTTHQWLGLGGLCQGKQAGERGCGSPGVLPQMGLRCLPLGPWVGEGDGRLDRDQVCPHCPQRSSSTLVSLPLPFHPLPSLSSNWGRGEGSDWL